MNTSTESRLRAWLTITRTPEGLGLLHIANPGYNFLYTRHYNWRLFALRWLLEGESWKGCQIRFKKYGVPLAKIPTQEGIRQFYASIIPKIGDFLCPISADENMESSQK